MVGQKQVSFQVPYYVPVGFLSPTHFPRCPRLPSRAGTADHLLYLEGGRSCHVTTPLSTRPFCYCIYSFPSVLDIYPGYNVSDVNFLAKKDWRENPKEPHNHVFEGSQN